ncbi:MAG: hypothetical protein WBK55_06400 [Alphaproteobacteria bacterium]
MYLLKNFLGLTDRLAGLFARKAQTGGSALVEEARELVARGEVNSFATGNHERLNQFFNKLPETAYGTYKEAIRALRVLSNAGCTPALQYRHTIGAERMGDEFFEGKDYRAYVVEHSVAYINGRNDVLRYMAGYCEGKFTGEEDKVGVLEAVDFIKNMRADYLRGSELNIVCGEYPEIRVVLRGDLMVYRAANTSDRKLAYTYLQEAREHGVSPKINMDQAFKTIMGRLSPEVP